MARRIPRQSIAALAAAVLLALLATGADQPLTPEQRAVMDHISADSLRGNLSFLASDLLEGRATPSRGLDLAAEYIAAQFRRAGLEPAGDDGYFQTATVTVREPNRDGFTMTVSAGGRTMTIAAGRSLYPSRRAFAAGRCRTRDCRRIAAFDHRGCERKGRAGDSTNACDFRKARGRL